MANYNWRVANGAFGLAADWSNTTTGDNPALTPPGTADTANLVGLGGTVTGTGSVDQLNINAATNPWVLSGTFTAVQLGGNGGFGLAAGAKLTLTGRPNSNPAFLPYSGNFVGMVTAKGAVIDSSGGNLVVGNGFGATPGALTLGGGSTMTALNLGVGQGATGTVTVDGAGSSLAVVTNPGLTYASILAFGQNYTPSGQATVHGTGHLAVTNGASVTADIALQVGADAGASGDVTIGSGASMTVRNRTTVGGNGTGSLAISGGGTLTTATNGATSPPGNANYDIVGDGAGVSGTVTIDGAGSKWTSGYQFIIGNFGSGAVTVGNGGALATAQLVSGQLAGSAGQLTVNAGGTVTSASSIVVGNTAGSQGAITVNAGGVLRNTAPAQTVGYLTLIGENGASGGQANAMGTVTVSGPGALFDTGLNGLILGASGSGSLTIRAGGSVVSGTTDSNSAAALAVARNAGSVATITITGLGSSLDAKGGAYVGRAGNATLTVDQGGIFVGGSTATGDGIGANAAFGVTIGDGPSTSTTDPFNGTATAQVTNSSTLRSRAYLEVGNRGGVGAMLVDGGSLVTADQQVRVGTGTTNPNASGTVTVQGASTLRGGGAWARGSASINVGRDASTTGVLTVTGGSLLDGNGGRIAVGSAGVGTLNLTGGARALAGAGYSDTEAALQIGAVAGGSGAVTVSGAGSQLVATGLAVIGGENLGAGLVAGGTGSVSLTRGGTFRATTLAMFAGSSITVDTTSTGEVGTGTQAVAVGVLTVDAGAALTGAGAVHTIVVNDGAVTAEGGTLSLDAAEGAGILGADGGTLDVLSGGAAKLAFGTSGSVIRLHSPLQAGVAVDGFVAGDVLDFVGQRATLSGNVVNVATGAYNFTSGSPLMLMDDGAGGTEVVACYCPGTRIRTAHGELPIETIEIGDRVVTLSGALAPVKWIGRRAYAARFARGRPGLAPVCIRAGALGDGVPRRDLYVSPRHAMYVDGVLIPAELLVNGTTITQPRPAGDVAYVHIELASHDVIWAEDAASETFVDDGSRGMFHNAADYAVRYPGEPTCVARYCAPRVADGPKVAAARQRFARRAAA